MRTIIDGLRCSALLIVTIMISLRNGRATFLARTKPYVFQASTLSYASSRARIHLASSREIRKKRQVVKQFLSTSSSPPPQRVKAAVSVCVRCNINNNKYYYLLVQRGKEPNKGMWSLPGGSLDAGEETVQGGVRELAEETVWRSPDGSNDDLFSKLKWYPGTVTTSDSIGEGFHYLIAHCFAELQIIDTQDLPLIQADDDAADAAWFLRTQIQDMESSSSTTQATHNITPGVMTVIRRVEELYEAGLLPTVATVPKK